MKKYTNEFDNLSIRVRLIENNIQMSSRYALMEDKQDWCYGSKKPFMGKIDKS